MSTEVETQVLPAQEKPKRKKAVRKVKIVPDSPYLVKDGFKQYYTVPPILCTWKEWVEICKIIRNSEYFRKTYKGEQFQSDDLETSGHVYPVWIKEPKKITDANNRVIEEIPGVYDEEQTLVLPPKFTFLIYRQDLMMHQHLQKFLVQPKLENYNHFKYEMGGSPRDEQQELGKKAEDHLVNKGHFRGIVQCPPGWGKGIFNDTLIPTPIGFKQMGDIKVNDEVFDREGKPTKVTGVYPQGNMDIYEFTFGDGTKTKVDETHLWKVWDTDNKKWLVLKTLEILSKNYKRQEKDKRYGEKSNGMRYKYFVPLCEPVKYPRNIEGDNRFGLNPLDHCFHPYALGLMLGDGSFRYSGNNFGFTDKYRKNTDRLFLSLKENGYIDDISISENESSSLTFRSKKLKEISKIFNLDQKYSIEKHIPREYLEASVESRKLLLEGLIATDGYIRTKSSWSYSTSSPKLKEDVCELARSLGYFVTVKVNKNNTYIHNGVKKQTVHDNYEICINYKKERKPIINIEKLDDQAETTCIKVDNKERLFLCNNFTVTHNTFISIYIAWLTGTQVLIVVPNQLLMDQWIASLLDFTGLTAEDIGIAQGSDMAKLKKKGVDKKPVIIAKIQSLDSQLKRKDFQELVDFYRQVGMVFYDETHTSGGADGYAKTTGIFSTCSIVGLSATPYKKDKNLFQLYTGIGLITYISTHQNLIPTCNMHLLDIPIGTRDQANLYNTHRNANYNLFMIELENFLYKCDAYFSYIADWIWYRIDQGYSCVVLFKTNKMLEKLQNIMENRIEKKIENSVILTRETAKTAKHLLNGNKCILSNYKMFSAGADYPHLSCILFGSMILGKIPIIQALGRTTRKFADKNQEVQAHFLLPKLIYPLFASREPHITIKGAVTKQYPTAQFKWDDGFKSWFQEKKTAGESLQAQNYQQYQHNNGYAQANQTNQANYTIQGASTHNRLSSYQSAKAAQPAAVPVAPVAPVTQQAPQGGGFGMNVPPPPPTDF